MFRVGILGCGNIAGQMAQAISELNDAEIYAVASRDIEKGKQFAARWNENAKVYDDYSKLANDSDIDLIYVATPHAFHYEHSMLCLKAGRNVLVEKPFAINKEQASEMIEYAHANNLFLQEAMWTRFVPGKEIIDRVIDSNELGRVKVVEANFSLNLARKERLTNPELGGGALLDLGIYCLTMAHMFIKSKVENIDTSCIKFPTGVDGTDYINLHFEDGREAVLKTSMIQGDANFAFIYLEKGYIYIEGINNISKIRIFNNKGEVIDDIDVEFMTNAYEYEVLASMEAIKHNQSCCHEMTHRDTLFVMDEMDYLRRMWEVKYPME